MKTETVHTRVDPTIKKEAEMIFQKIGLTTSQAIMLFLTAAVNHKGMPFELSLPSNNVDLKFATSIAAVDGVMPSEEAKRIMTLYSNGDIDYETAQFAIKRLYK